MVQFNELRITPDSKYLVIDASVKDEPYYDNVAIDSIAIDTQDTYINSGPSSKAKIIDVEKEEEYLYSLPENNSCNPVLEDSDKSYCFTYTSEVLKGKKHVRIYLSSKDLGVDIQNNMFFVYIIAAGTPAPDTPCGMDNSITMGTVMDLYPMYRESVYRLEEMDDDCNIPKCLIDNILRIKSLELSVKTGNYPKAIQYWNKWFKDIKTVRTNTCNCYGTGN